jgi:carbonic anhydrase/acetyltransferase-like protein (isoleucine patch superfamily)
MNPSEEQNQANTAAPHAGRRGWLKAGLAGAAAITSGAASATLSLNIPGLNTNNEEGRYLGHSDVRSGPVGFTSFIHPTAKIQTTSFSIGAQSLIEGFVTLNGASARIGNATNLQDNDRLLDYTSGRTTARGDLQIGDGSFTAHGVTFIGKVRIGDACGTVINAVVQNARVGDASITGFTARILGEDPNRPIQIPEASLVLFGARIRSQADVAANIIPIPAPFSLFAADVDQENLLLARGYNLLHRAASRTLPFSAEPNSPRNPGADFPNLATAFGKLSVAPPTVSRRGTGPLPARQASLGDLGFQVFEPFPLGAPGTPLPNGPAPDSPAAGARFIKPRVASPDLVDNGAIVLGGVELGTGVVVGAGSYLHGADSPSISIGAGTQIGRNTSVHQLTFTSVRIGTQVSIGDRVVLHGPLEIGNRVTIGNGAVLFGPRVADGVRIGAGAVVFGPVEVTRDVPAGAIIVAAGNEGLIAPSHNAAQAALAPVASTLPEWRLAMDAGGGCGCGAGALLHHCSANA